VTLLFLVCTRHLNHPPPIFAPFALILAPHIPSPCGSTGTSTRVWRLLRPEPPRPEPQRGPSQSGGPLCQSPSPILCSNKQADPPTDFARPAQVAQHIQPDVMQMIFNVSASMVCASACVCSPSPIMHASVAHHMLVHVGRTLFSPPHPAS
jgi:hypothetical protein